MKRPRLTVRELETVLAAAGNVDPCMFEENAASDKEADRDLAAYKSGIKKNCA